MPSSPEPVLTAFSLSGRPSGKNHAEATWEAGTSSHVETSTRESPTTLTTVPSVRLELSDAGSEEGQTLEDVEGSKGRTTTTDARVRRGRRPHLQDSTAQAPMAPTHPWGLLDTTDQTTANGSLRDVGLVQPSETRIESQELLVRPEQEWLSGYHDVCHLTCTSRHSSARLKRQVCPVCFCDPLCRAFGDCCADSEMLLANASYDSGKWRR